MRFLAWCVPLLFLCGCAARRPLEYRHRSRVLYPPRAGRTLRFVSTAAKIPRGKDCEFRSSAVHVRWSGNAAQVRLGRGSAELGPETERLGNRLDEAGCLAPGESLELTARILENAPAENGSLLSLSRWQEGYVDLEPGIMLRAVSPILPEGANRLEMQSVASQGGEIQLKSNLVGYETAWYGIGQDSEGRGLIIRLAQAEDTISGVKTPPPAPRKNYLQQAPPGYLRLVVLTRLSKADHNITLVSARSRKLIEQITARLADEPDATLQGVTLVNIPSEVALSAIRQVEANGRTLDVPVGENVREVLKTYDFNLRNELPKTLAIWRPYRGRLIRVAFEAGDREILNLALVGGERFTW